MLCETSESIQANPTSDAFKGTLAPLGRSWPRLLPKMNLPENLAPPSLSMTSSTTVQNSGIFLYEGANMGLHLTLESLSQESSNVLKSLECKHIICIETSPVGRNS